MAENKKSFILYCDLLQTIEKLPDDVAGKLLKIILQYVNDKSPVVDDLLLQIAFEPIKQQLKRDLKDWEETRGERVKSGHLGGIKSGESRRKKKMKQMLQNRSKTKQSEANEAVNVTVTVTDTVNEEIKKDFLNEILLPFTSESFQASWQKWKDYRHQELKKEYKSIQSEQAALSHLENISQKNEYAALQIIDRSIANQWQGLFELKNEKNGSSSNQQRQATARANIIEIGKREFAALRKEDAGG